MNLFSLFLLISLIQLLRIILPWRRFSLCIRWSTGVSVSLGSSLQVLELISEIHLIRVLLFFIPGFIFGPERE